MRVTGKTLNCVLWCLAPLLLVQYLLLVRQVKLYRSALYPPLVSAGSHLGRLVAFDMAGAREEVAFPGTRHSRVLIITMSPNCPVCRMNEPTWAVLTSVLHSNPEWKVIWVSRDSVEATRRYCAANSLSMANAVADPTMATYSMLTLYAVPNTIVTDAGGVVQKSWSGRLGPEKCREISQFIGVPYKTFMAEGVETQSARN